MQSKASSDPFRAGVRYTLAIVLQVAYTAGCEGVEAFLGEIASIPDLEFESLITDETNAIETVSTLLAEVGTDKRRRDEAVGELAAEMMTIPHSAAPALPLSDLLTLSRN